MAGTISLVSVGLGAVIPLLGDFAKAEDLAAEASKKHADEVKRLNEQLTDEEENIKKAADELLKQVHAKTVMQAIAATMEMEARKAPVTEEDIGKVMAEIPGIGTAEARDIFVGDRIKAARERATIVSATLATDPSSRAEAIRLASGAPRGVSRAIY